MRYRWVPEIRDGAAREGRGKERLKIRKVLRGDESVVRDSGRDIHEKVNVNTSI
jgi:hypothetical protein